MTSGDALVTDIGIDTVFRINLTTGDRSVVSSAFSDPRGIVLEPIPEPSTFVLLCIGLVALARTSGDAQEENK